MSRRGRRRLAEAPADLNLVPLLDMVSLLIQLMLVNVEFDTLVQVPTQMGATSDTPDKGLQFSVIVDDNGYHATWQEGSGWINRDYPCRSETCSIDTYDRDGLAALSRSLRGVDANAHQVVVRPSVDVPVDVIIGAMDALRGPKGDQFNDIVIGAAP